MQTGWKAFWAMFIMRCCGDGCCSVAIVTIADVARRGVDTAVQLDQRDRMGVKVKCSSHALLWWRKERRSVSVATITQKAEGVTVQWNQCADGSEGKVCVHVRGSPYTTGAAPTRYGMRQVVLPSPIQRATSAERACGSQASSRRRRKASMSLSVTLHRLATICGLQTYTRHVSHWELLCGTRYTLVQGNDRGIYSFRSINKNDWWRLA